MAKYKQPKNEKHKARKDLKDYTVDKEVEGMVPNASGEVMPDVPRKDDKEVANKWSYVFVLLHHVSCHRAGIPSNRVAGRIHHAGGRWN